MAARWVEIRGMWLDAEAVQFIDRVPIEDYEYTRLSPGPEVARLTYIGGATEDIPLTASVEEADAMTAAMSNRTLPASHWHSPVDPRLPRFDWLRPKARARYNETVAEDDRRRAANEYIRVWWAEATPLVESFRDELFASIVKQIRGVE